MAYKTAYATELDANVDTDLEEVGTLREHNGVVYKWIQASGGITTGKALVVAAASTPADTLLSVAAANDPRPIEAFGQSSITDANFGWVIYEGEVKDAVQQGMLGPQALLKAGPTAGYVTSIRWKEQGPSMAHAIKTGYDGSTITVKIR